jgi:hypothetical protein
MSALLLSLLLIVLIAIGLIMGHKVKETFENMSAADAVATPTLGEASTISAPLATPPQVDVLQRGLQEQQTETRHPLGPGGEQKKPDCPVCKQCPDMSKYIRMDEIPCWNCTLP